MYTGTFHDVKAAAILHDSFQHISEKLLLVYMIYIIMKATLYSIARIW